MPTAPRSRTPAEPSAGPVLIVTPWYLSELGGVAQVAERLHTGLRRAGVDAHLLVTDGGRRIAPHRDRTHVWTMDVPSYVFQSLRPRALMGSLLRSPPAVRQLRRFLQERDIRVVVLLYPIEYVWPFLFLRATGRIRIVTSLHGNDVENYERYPRQLRWLVRRGLRRSDTVVVCADHLARTSRRISGDPELPTRLIPNCVDTSHFTPPPVRRDEERPPTVVHVSNFARKKRAVDIVEAFARADLPDDTRLVMVGEGPTLDETKRRARQLGVAEQVEFAGVQDDVRPFLRRADVFALASDSEGAPLVLLEAMACGLPWVSTAWGAAADLPPGECGLVVPAADPARFAEALERMLSDDDERRAMGRRARERALSQYSVQAYVDAHIEVIHEAERRQ